MAVPVIEATQVHNVTSNATTSGSISFSLGTVSENDVIFIACSLDGDAASPTATAYTTFGGTSEGSVEMYFMWKRMGATPDSSVTINWTGSEQGRFKLMRVSGCVTSGSIIDVTGSGSTFASDGSPDITGITTLTADTLAICGVAVDRDRVDNADIVQSGSFSKVGVWGNSGGANGSGLCVASRDMATAGATGNCEVGNWTADQAAGNITSLKGAAAGSAIVKNPTTGTVGITDANNLGLRKNNASTVGLTESKNLGVRKTVGDILDITEDAFEFRKIFNIPNTLGLTELFNLRHVKNNSSTLGLTEQPNLSHRKNNNSTIDITEASNHKVFALIVQVINTIVDLIEGRNLGHRKNNISTVGLTESRNLGLRKSISDFIDLTENALQSRKIQVINTILDLTESFNLGLRKTTPADTVGLTETKNLGLRKNTSSTVGITEARNWIVSVGGAAIVKVINTIVDLSESFNLGIRKSVGDTVNLTELKNLAHRKNNSSTVGLTEARNRLKAIIQNIPDTVGITFDRNRVIGFVKNIPDTIGLTSAQNRNLGLVRNISSVVGITEAFNKLQSLIRNIISTVGLVELSNRLLGTPATSQRTKHVTAKGFSRNVDATGFSRNVSGIGHNRTVRAKSFSGSETI